MRVPTAIYPPLLHHSPGHDPILSADSIRLASSVVITAILHNLSGAFDVDLRHDETRTWAGMELIILDDSEVGYERF